MKQRSINISTHNATMRAVFRFVGITSPLWAIILPAIHFHIFPSIPGPFFIPAELWFYGWYLLFFVAASCTAALLTNRLKLNADTIIFPPLRAMHVPIKELQSVGWFWHTFEKQIYLRFSFNSYDHIDIHHLRLSPYKLRILNQAVRTFSPNCKIEFAPEDLEDVIRLRERFYKPPQFSLQWSETEDAADSIEIPYQPHEQFEKFKQSLLANEKYFWYCWIFMWTLPCSLALPTILWRQGWQGTHLNFGLNKKPPLATLADSINDFLGHFVWDVSSGTLNFAYTWTKNPIVLCMLLGVAFVGAMGLLIFFMQPNQIILRSKYLQIIYRWKWIIFFERKLAWKDIVSFGLDQFGDGANPEKWRVQIVMKDGYVQNLNVEAIKGLCARETLLKTMSQLAPDAVIDPGLIRALMPPQRESYTELWLQSLSAPPKRNRLAPLTEGQKLKSGKFTVTRQLAAGGQGVAYTATDETFANTPMNVCADLRTSVVLKEFVLPVYTSRAVRKQALERFENEAHILETLDHPQIVKLKDFFIEDHRAYLVLEHINGLSLRELVQKNGPMSQSQIHNLAKQMCTVLEYLHSLSPPVVHRDFTPDNLILDANGRLVLIDFNVAQQKQWTTTSTVVGKHAYLPAEQFRGYPVIQSDLYAMGATLFFLSTGKDPEPITCSHPRSVDDKLPDSFDALVAKLTADEVENRFQSASETHVALVSAETSTAEIHAAMDTTETSNVEGSNLLTSNELTSNEQPNEQSIVLTLTRKQREEIYG